MRHLRQFLQPYHLRALYGVLVLLAVSSCLAHAQARDTVPPDTKGKEFWVTFPASWGSGPPDLRLYLSCDRPTKASVIYAGKTGISFDLPVANVPLEINISQYFDTTAELDWANAATEISTKSFHIIANDEITLYGCTIRE